MSEVPIAARLAAAILGGGILEGDRANAEESQLEAEAMNQVFRELEARKMDQTVSALKHAAFALGPAIRAAAEATIAKEAMGVPTAIAGGLARAGSTLKRGFGGAAQAAGRLMPAGPAKQSWMSLGTKAKLVGGAALLGTGYAGYKGMQAARNYMQAQPHSGWGKGPPIPNNVNEFGHPEY